MTTTSDQAPGGATTDLPERLRAIVAAYLKMDAGDLRDDMELGHDLCMDSLAAAEMLVVIEEELDLELPTQLVLGGTKVTYGSVSALVCEHVAGQR